jgi:trigger factor
MTIKEISSKKLFKEYGLEIPYDEVDNMINNKIAEIIPTVSLPGFRKGKAPINIVKKKYENNFLSEVIEKIVKEKTKKLLEDKKLKAFRQPKVEVKKYVKNESLEISIKIDLEPEIKLFSFEDIEIKNRSINLDEKKIDENYKNFIDSQKHYHKVAENRPIKLSDRILVNISTLDESVPDFLKSQNNLSIITDSDYQILPDISNRLIDKKAKIGDSINLTFDLKEVVKAKNKKEVKFIVEILDLESVHKFSVTNKFLEQNNLNDENHLKENLKKNLFKQYEDDLKQIQKKELMDLLDSKNKFDVPEGILEEEISSILHRLEHAKKDGKMDDDDKDLSEDQLKNRYEKIALRRVRLSVLLQHIAKKENIIVSEKDLTDGMLNYASQYPGQEKEIFEYFKKNPSSVESIRGPIFEQKILDHVLSKVELVDEKINFKKFEKLQLETFNNKEAQ